MPDSPVRRTRPQYACSFCGRSQEETGRLVAGPSAAFVFICDPCISASARVVRQDSLCTEAPGRLTRTEVGGVSCSFCGKPAVSGLPMAELSDVRICRDCISL